MKRAVWSKPNFRNGFIFFLINITHSSLVLTWDQCRDNNELEQQNKLVISFGFNEPKARCIIRGSLKQLE